MSHYITTKTNELIASNEYQQRKDIFEVWLSDYTSENTRLTYLSAVIAFIKYSRKMPLDISRKDCIAYRDYLLSDKANSTVNNHMAAITSFFDALLSAGKIDTNPMKNVKRLKQGMFEKSKALDPSKEQDIKFLQSISQDTEKNARDYALIMLLMVTGLRVSAIANCTIGDIVQSLDKTVLQYVNKGGEQKEKTLPVEVFAALQTYFKYRTISLDSPLFVSVQSKNSKLMIGRPLTRQAITKLVSDRAKKSGFTGITAHTLRHTSAMVLYAETGDVKQVQKHLEHKNLGTTAIYLDHLTNQQNDNAVNVISSRYAAKPKPE